MKYRFAFVAFILGLIGLFCHFAAKPAFGNGTLIWEGDVLGSGVEVVSPLLQSDRLYRIVSTGSWWYNYDDNLAADAMYYTTDFSNNIFWGNHYPAPSGHSFLQIDGQDVDWGPFSNGETGHTYTIRRLGQDVPVSFRIVDWIDGNYAENGCHLHVSLYMDVTVGGTVQDPTHLSACFAVFSVVVIVTVAAMASRAHIGGARVAHV